MAWANQLRAIVTADTRLFHRGMRRVEMAAARTAKKSKAEMALLQNQLDKTAVSANIMAGVLTTVVIAALTKTAQAIKALNSASLDASKGYESQRIRLQLLAGDMRKGAKEFERIRKFAEESPFDTDQITDAYIKLRALTGMEYASEQIENVAYAAAVADKNISTMADRVAQLVLRLKTGLTGGLLAKSLRTFGDTFGAEATQELVEMAQRGENSELIIERLTEALQRYGKEAKTTFGNSAKGLEGINKGLKKAALAQLGEQSLEAYKDILKELNVILKDVTKTDDFKALGEALKMMNEQMSEIVRSKEFKQFLMDIMTITRAIVMTVSALMFQFRMMSKLPLMPGDIFRPDRMNQKLSNIGSIGISGSELLQGGQIWIKELLGESRQTRKNTGASANVLDPQNAVSGDRR